jgi:hypothetical protein
MTAAACVEHGRLLLVVCLKGVERDCITIVVQQQFALHEHATRIKTCLCQRQHWLVGHADVR